MTYIWNLLMILFAGWLNTLMVVPAVMIVNYVHPLTEPMAWASSLLTAVGAADTYDNRILCLAVAVMTAGGALYIIAGYIPPLRGLNRVLMGAVPPECFQDHNKTLNAALIHLSEKSGIPAEEIRKKYYFTIIEEGSPNAWAYGTRDISITTGLIGRASPRIVAATIAHEIGHHLIGDTYFATFYNGMWRSTWLCIQIIRAATFLLGLLRFLPVIGIVCALLTWVPAILSWIFYILQRIPQALLQNFFLRQSEFKADANIVKMGLGEEGIEMLQFFLKVCGDTSLFFLPFVDHPRTKSRIKHIQKLMEKQNGYVPAPRAVLSVSDIPPAK